MIRSAKILSGFAVKLPAIKGKSFKFTEGLNVLFGPNGCGKTSTIGIVAAHAGCYETGWSKPTINTDEGGGLDRSKRKEVPYPGRFALDAPGKCTASVVWDGLAAMLYRVGVDTNASHFDYSDNDHFQEQLVTAFAKPSAGQIILGRLHKLGQTLLHAPDLTDRDRLVVICGNNIQYKSVNDTWQKAIDDFVNYVKKLPRDSAQITLLIDEPDRSMSIPNQRDLWAGFMPKIAERVQVISASHSLFALAAPGANLIEMEPHYVKNCLECMAGLKPGAKG